LKKEKKHNKKKPQENDSFSQGAIKHVLSALAIIILASFIYGGSFDSPFIFDDRLNITENPYIRITKLEPAQIKRAAVQDKFQLRAISNLTFALDYYFHKLNLRVMHVENIIVHILSSFMLYLAVYFFISFSYKERLSNLSKWLAALFAALVWSAHPAHTQAVIYIVQRQTLLAVLFSLLSFFFYMLSHRSDSMTHKFLLLILCTISFVVSAFCKEISWTVPLIIFLYELLIIRQIGKKLELKKLSGIVLAIFITGGLGLFLLLKTEILTSYLVSYKYLDYGPWQRMLTECRVVFSYLITIFFPFPSRLSFDHDVIVSTSISDPMTTLLALVLFMSAVMFGVWKIRNSPYPLFLILGYLIVLAPESSFIPVDLKNDHRIYMPSLFIIPPVVVFVFSRIGNKKSIALMTLLLILFAASSFSRTFVWKSEESIWLDAANKYPDLTRPWNNLCSAQSDGGSLEKALLSCSRAIELSPHDEYPILNRAIVLMKLGHVNEAEVHFKKAASINPKNDIVRYNYGAFLEKEGNKESALSQYNAALGVNPHHQLARYRRALILYEAGKSRDAVSELELLIRMYPDFEAAKNALYKIKLSY